MTITIPDDGWLKYTWNGKAIRLNGKYGATTRGRHAALYTTTAYKGFVESMATSFRIQHEGRPLSQHVAVLLFFTLSKRSTHPDTDAYNKQVLDALEHGGVLENDNLVQFQAAMNSGVVDPLATEDAFLIYVLPLKPGGEIRIA